MTTPELIALLQQFPANTPVCFVPTEMDGTPIELRAGTTVVCTQEDIDWSDDVRPVGVYFAQKD